MKIIDWFLQRNEYDPYAYLEEMRKDGEAKLAANKARYDREKAEVDAAWAEYWRNVQEYLQEFHRLRQDHPDIPNWVPQSFLPLQMRTFHSTLITVNGLSGWSRDLPAPIDTTPQMVIDYWLGRLRRGQG